MHPNMFARFRRGPLALSMVSLAAAATALVALSPTPKAHAEPGRRICKYVWMQGMGNPEGRSVSFVVDYKKDGACPYVDLHKVQLSSELGSWMPPPDTWEAQPAPKLTCEEFQTSLHLPSSGSGGDPCTYMSDDRFYGVTSWKDGDPNPPDPNKRRIWDLGSVWDLG